MITLKTMVVMKIILETIIVVINQQKVIIHLLIKEMVQKKNHILVKKH